MMSKKRKRQLFELEKQVGNEPISLEKAISVVLDRQSDVDPTTTKALIGALQTNNNLLKQATSVLLSSQTTDMFMPFLKNMDLNQIGGMFSFYGKDYPYRDEFKLTQMLYYSGQLVMLPFTKEGVKFFKIGGNTKLTSYGVIDKIRVVQFNGYLSAYESTLVDRDYTNYEDCLLLNWGIQDFTGQTAHSPRNFNLPILRSQAKVLARIGMNVDVNAKKMIIQVEDTATQKDINRSMTENISNDSAVVTVGRGSIDLLDLSPKGGLDAGELWHIFKQYNSLRLNRNGIPSMPLGTDKGERLITGEVDNNMFNYDMVHDTLFTIFKKFCKNCKELFNLDIRVKSNVEKLKEDKKEMLGHE